MKKKIIIFTKEEMKKLELKKRNNYYIIHKTNLNKISNRKCNRQKLH